MQTSYIMILQIELVGCKTRAVQVHMVIEVFILILNYNFLENLVVTLSSI